MSMDIQFSATTNSARKGEFRTGVKLLKLK